MNAQTLSRPSRQIALALFLALAPATAIALADPINYGDFGPDPPGTTMYLDVTESSGTDPVPPGRFGEPELTGDLLDFDPSEFLALAAGGEADITDVQLNFTLMTTPLAGANTLLISESGNYSLTGLGTTLTQVAAGLSVHLKILAVDGNPLLTPVDFFASSSFDANLFDDGPAVLAGWVNGFLIDLDGILDEEEIPYELGVSKAEVVIDNQLIAISEAESEALIFKTDFFVGTNDVLVAPEPSSWMMMALAIGILAPAFRRRLQAGSTRRPPR